MSNRFLIATHNGMVPSGLWDATVVADAAYGTPAALKSAQEQLGARKLHGWDILDTGDYTPANTADVLILQELENELTTQWDAFCEFLSEGFGPLDGAVEQFEEAYCGRWQSLEDFAHFQLIDCDEEYSKIYNSGSRGYSLKLDMIAWEYDYTITNSGHVFRSI